MGSRLSLLDHGGISDTLGADILRPSLLPETACRKQQELSLIYLFLYLKMSMCSSSSSYLNIRHRLTTFPNGMKTPSPKTALRCPPRSSRKFARPKMKYKGPAVSLSVTTLLLRSELIQNPERPESRTQISDLAPPKTRLR